VIGENVLVLLLYHHNANLKIQFRSDSKSTKTLKIWDMEATQTSLGTAPCHTILLLHGRLVPVKMTIPPAHE